MPRTKTKKISQASDTEETQTIELPKVNPRRKRGKPVATRQHSILTTYAEDVPIDELAETDNGQASFLELEEEQERPARLEPIDRIRQEMLRVGPSGAWEASIYRMPNYDIDMRTDTRAHRERVGKIVFNPETYEDIIAKMFAKPGKINVFLPEVRLNNIWFCQLPIIRCEPPPMEEAPHLYGSFSPAQNGLSPALAPVAPVDPFDHLAKTVKLIREVRTAIPETAIAATPAQTEIATTEQALVKLMNADQGLVDKFMGKFQTMFTKGGGDHEITIMDILFKAIELELPAKMLDRAHQIIVELKNGSTSMGAAPMAAPSQVQVQGTQSSGVASIPEGQAVNQAIHQGLEQVQGTTPPANVPLQQAPEAELLSTFIGALSANYDIEETAGWIEAFATVRPQVSYIVDGFISMPVDDALNYFKTAMPQASSVLDAPHARGWIEQLQQALKGDETNEETNS